MPSPSISSSISAVIEAIDLSKRVKLASGEELTILQNVSFALERGETLALLGASGSGKSTLLSLLAGLDTPTSGEVRILGKNLAQLGEDQRAKLRGENMGFVFQSFQLLPALTALENVMLPIELSQRPFARQRAEHWLESVGLTARAHHYPKQLSGGEQQRVALARALVVEPAILFADEPTGNLDAATGAQISELMLSLNQDLSTTLIVVTHDAELARRCKKTLHLQEGKLLANEASIY